MRRLLAFVLILLAALASAPAVARTGADVGESAAPRAVPLLVAGQAAGVLVGAGEDPAVRRAAANLVSDFGRVGGSGALLAVAPGRAEALVIVGTIGRSPLVDRLIANGKLDVRGVKGTWEAYVHQVVERPLPGVTRALVIAGADRRGTVFGVYDLSQRIGVSPWHWWADVPPKRRASLYAYSGRRVEAPAVKYRGIFINDEEPALGTWARARFGGINAKFYEHVFELILRQRGNFLWPAMWGKSLWEDDPASAALAHEMGVVLSTSHHEPMMRAHVDWERGGKGPWDYTKNPETLRGFWREGVKRTNGQDRIVTVGMRGNGDEPMTEGTATRLLETIVADQRKVIAEATGRPAEETPQVWALYKEVQDYYDAGMRVPDDVTLLFADDNWGNIRRLPKPGETRPGGYGVYYHFDYVGGPRNYKWINTTQIERVWQQMRLAYDHGARQLWIVNVGDIKPMELPTSFFLDYAWNPDAWPLERLPDYPAQWAETQFGPSQAPEIGRLLTRYAQLAARRKPELLSPDTYSLTAWNEWDRVVGEWRALRAEAEAVERRLAPGQRDAYFHLVLHPILAFANLHELYRTVALNRAHAAQGLPDTNALAEEAKRLFARDAALSARYEATAGGKWTGMMSQTHISYTGWQQPERDVMPEVRTLPVGSATAPLPPLTVTVPAPAAKKPGSGFVERDGYVAMEAAHFDRAVSRGGVRWRVIPNLGRTLSSVTAFPVTAPSQVPGKGAYLEYRVQLETAGEVELEVLTSPDLDFRGKGGLRYAVSIEGEAPQIVNVEPDRSEKAWEQAVAENVRCGRTKHRIARPGRYTVKLWLVDPGLVFQRLVLSTRPLPASYLGPPESRRGPARTK